MDRRSRRVAHRADVRRFRPADARVHRRTLLRPGRRGVRRLVRWGARHPGRSCGHEVARAPSPRVASSRDVPDQARHRAGAQDRCWRRSPSARWHERPEPVRWVNAFGRETSPRGSARTRPVATRLVARRHRHPGPRPVAVRPGVEEGVGEPGDPHRERVMARVDPRPTRDGDGRTQVREPQPQLVRGQETPVGARFPAKGRFTAPGT